MCIEREMKTKHLFIYFLILFILTACKEDKPTPRYKHDTFGVVDVDHPEYQKAHNFCDQKIYGQGVDIDGEIITSKKDAWNKIFPIAKSIKKTQEDYKVITEWTNIQKQFILCVESEGFVYYKP